MGDCDIEEKPPESTKLQERPDPSVYYTWKYLFSLFKGNATHEQVRKYYDAKDVAKEAEDCERCEKNTKWLLNNSM